MENSRSLFTASALLFFHSVRAPPNFHSFISGLRRRVFVVSQVGDVLVGIRPLGATVGVTATGGGGSSVLPLLGLPFDKVCFKALLSLVVGKFAGYNDSCPSQRRLFFSSSHFGFCGVYTLLLFSGPGNGEQRCVSVHARLEAVYGWRPAALARFTGARGLLHRRARSRTRRGEQPRARVRGG